MLTMTSQYALRAMVHLARHEDDWPVPGREIAAQTQIPAKYLSKILGDLVRAGVLSATRGLGGGFRMVRPAGETALYDVLTPFESFELRQCPFGNKECGETDPCLAHHDWKKVIEAQHGFLKATTVQDVAIRRAERPKRRRKKR